MFINHSYAVFIWNFLLLKFSNIECASFGDCRIHSAHFVVAALYCTAIIRLFFIILIVRFVWSGDASAYCISNTHLSKSNEAI